MRRSPTAINFSKELGTSPNNEEVKYAEKVIAASAVGAANPTDIEIHPETNPAAGW